MTDVPISDTVLYASLLTMSAVRFRLTKSHACVGVLEPWGDMIRGAAESASGDLREICKHVFYALRGTDWSLLKDKESLICTTLDALDWHDRWAQAIGGTKDYHLMLSLNVGTLIRTAEIPIGLALDTAICDSEDPLKALSFFLSL